MGTMSLYDCRWLNGNRSLEQRVVGPGIHQLLQEEAHRHPIRYLHKEHGLRSPETMNMNMDTARMTERGLIFIVCTEIFYFFADSQNVPIFVAIFVFNDYEVSPQNTPKQGRISTVIQKLPNIHREIALSRIPR